MGALRGVHGSDVNRHSLIHGGVERPRSERHPTALSNAVRVLGRVPSHESARVLVVEDDPEVRQLMRIALEDDAREVVEAHSGLEAFAQCRRAAEGSTWS